MKNLLVGVQEIAPPCCVVCGKSHPDGENVPGWVYLAGAVPFGAIACSPACTAKAVDRHERTGRVDTPEMRVR